MTAIAIPNVINTPDQNPEPLRPFERVAPRPEFRHRRLEIIRANTSFNRWYPSTHTSGMAMDVAVRTTATGNSKRDHNAPAYASNATAHPSKNLGPMQEEGRRLIQKVEPVHLHMRDGPRPLNEEVGFSEKCPSRRECLRLQADPIVHRAPKALLASQVPLRGLHRDVPKEELDLFQFATGRVAQTGARSTTIVR